MCSGPRPPFPAGGARPGGFGAGGGDVQTTQVSIPDKVCDPCARATPSALWIVRLIPLDDRTCCRWLARSWAAAARASSRSASTVAPRSRSTRRCPARMTASSPSVAIRSRSRRRSICSRCGALLFVDDRVLRITAYCIVQLLHSVLYSLLAAWKSTARSDVDVVPFVV